MLDTRELHLTHVIHTTVGMMAKINRRSVHQIPGLFKRHMISLVSSARPLMAYDFCFKTTR